MCKAEIFNLRALDIMLCYEELQDYPLLCQFCTFTAQGIPQPSVLKFCVDNLIGIWI